MCFCPFDKGKFNIHSPLTSALLSDSPGLIAGCFSCDKLYCVRQLAANFSCCLFLGSRHTVGGRIYSFYPQKTLPALTMNSANKCNIWSYGWYYCVDATTLVWVLCVFAPVIPLLESFTVTHTSGWHSSSSWSPVAGGHAGWLEQSPAKPSRWCGGWRDWTHSPCVPSAPVVPLSLPSPDESTTVNSVTRLRADWTTYKCLMKT